ncbi:MAG: hypothetical protein FJ308_20940, partial [Planctomycetes bacterium]|nr:hypothetical protein [Planctomycetota bacterium]
MAQRLLIGLSVVAIAVSLGTFWWNTRELDASSNQSVASATSQSLTNAAGNIEVQRDEYSPSVASGTVRLASAQERLSLPPSGVETTNETVTSDKPKTEK